jgi:hypothetical protein
MRECRRAQPFEKNGHYSEGNVQGQLRSEGLSLRGIADTLNQRAIPTAQGGQRWHAQTVSNVVKRSAA